MILILQSAYSKTQIYMSQGKYTTYYHIAFKLIQTNFILPQKQISNNGQFEILISKSKFPIDAPNCNKNIILRMPSTSAAKDVKPYEGREALFNKILEVKKGTIKSLDVVIELNPYINILNANPPDIQLQYCNVFFRTSKDQYINSVDHS